MKKKVSRRKEENREFYLIFKKTLHVCNILVSQLFTNVAQTSFLENEFIYLFC